MVAAKTSLSKTMAEAVANRAPKINGLKEETTWRYIESLFEQLPSEKVKEAKIKLVSLVMDMVADHGN